MSTRNGIESLREIDKLVKRGLVEDEGLNKFLSPFFSSKTERINFIVKCLQKNKSRRMMLRAQWYAEIADSLERVKNNRPALQIIFLMSLAEGVTRLRTNNDGDDNVSSKTMIHDFFRYTTASDKKLLARKFTRALTKAKHNNLTFSSVVNILYDIRNKAVHGYDFYSFSLLDKNQEKEFVEGGYTHYGIMTSGFLGKTNRKRRVSLDISLTYEELRCVIVRTALENINAVFD